MKKNIFLAFFFLSFCLYSQSNERASLFNLNEKKIGWGFFLGINHFDFSVKVKKENIKTQKFFINTKSGLGFHGGLLVKYPLYTHLEFLFSPAMYFLERELYFSEIKFSKGSQKNYFQDFIKIKSTYLEIPLGIKFAGDEFYAMRPFLAAAGAYIINLQSNENKKPTKEIFPLKKHNFNWQVEGGVEFYFSYFKLILSAKVLFFITNELVKSHTNSLVGIKNLECLKTKAIIFSLKLE